MKVALISCRKTRFKIASESNVDLGKLFSGSTAIAFLMKSQLKLLKLSRISPRLANC